MNNSTSRTEELLVEIRELLQIIAEAQGPQYRAVVLKRLGNRAAELQKLVNTAKQWEALRLMDGARTQVEIAEAVRLDGASLSKFVKRVETAGFVERVGNRPRCKLTRAELEAIEEGTDAR